MVAQGGERSCAGANAASVLVECDVADVVEAVLDRPVGAGEGQNALGSGLIGRQAGDEVDDFDALAATDQAAALEPGDLRQSRPAEILDGLDRERDAAGFDAPVALFDRLGLTQVGEGGG